MNILTNACNRNKTKSFGPSARKYSPHYVLHRVSVTNRCSLYNYSLILGSEQMFACCKHYGILSVVSPVLPFTTGLV